MRTINDFSMPTATGLGGAVRRAAMMLLVMLLTPDDSQGDNRSRLLNSINTWEDEDLGEEF